MENQYQMSVEQALAGSGQQPYIIPGDRAFGGISPTGMQPFLREGSWRHIAITKAHEMDDESRKLLMNGVLDGTAHSIYVTAPSLGLTTKIFDNIGSQTNWKVNVKGNEIGNKQIFVCTSMQLLVAQVSPGDDESDEDVLGSLSFKGPETITKVFNGFMEFEAGAKHILHDKFPLNQFETVDYLKAGEMILDRPFLLNPGEELKAQITLAGATPPEKLFYRLQLNGGLIKA